MTPQELLDSCIARILEWNDGERFSDEPTICLTLQRTNAPTGDSVRLYGRSGPKGRLATCRQRDGGWMVVAYFPAHAIAVDVALHLGLDAASVPVPVLKDGSMRGRRRGQ